MTNPPYCKKLEFVERCLELGKPFAMLMSTQLITVRKSIEVFKKASFGLGVLAPNVKFLRNDKLHQAGDTAWYFCNFPHIPQDRKGWTWIAQLENFPDRQRQQIALLEGEGDDGDDDDEVADLPERLASGATIGESP